MYCNREYRVPPSPHSLSRMTEPAADTSPTGRPALVKHIVFWNVAGESAEARDYGIRQIKAHFETLGPLISGLVKLEIGVNLSPVDYACDMALYSEFESWEALEAYSGHVSHLKVREAIQGLRIARYQVDYEVG